MRDLDVHTCSNGVTTRPIVKYRYLHQHIPLPPGGVYHLSVLASPNVLVLTFYIDGEIGLP